MAIAELTALAVAIIRLFAFIFKLSSLVSFISESILLGFKVSSVVYCRRLSYRKFLVWKAGK
jgi:MFS superfamily sulfate permease-like transporter